MNWQALIAVALVAFYAATLGFRVVIHRFPYYAQDFLAFWSAGKIADTSGYSQIYDIDQFKNIVAKELIRLGLLDTSTISDFFPIPVPYFAVFPLVVWFAV